ncbi:hypothetical protein DSL72_006827 [Monilinia vaccinii-corymbosi]|uniref:Uncharacterized protein n=1 Tax=Monilinia vaccinii-corymbosi TaxID=61207 RepID=A0A8A3PL41_9HELO|nr:hypothetical protein DSL72_006827 [Monilinia vaccinii-corymbosi]
MNHQPSSCQLFFDCEEQEFRNHEQQQYCSNEPKGNVFTEISNSTQNISEAKIGAQPDYVWNNSHIEKNHLYSYGMFGFAKTVGIQRSGLEPYKSCTASNRGMQSVGKRHEAPLPSFTPIDNTSSREVSTITSRKCLINARIREMMGENLCSHLEIQNQHDSPSFTTTHTQTFPGSSRPVLSCSTASNTSISITTPVVDHNQFDILNWEEAMSPTQPISMPNIICEQELFPMTSRDDLALKEYWKRKEMDKQTSEFIPSSILKGESRLPNPNMARKAAEVGVALNPNYKGELTNFNLRNAMCRDHENCSVRIHNIPPEAIHSEIFAVVTHGKVFSFNYIPPIKGVFTHAAADLVFFTREAAENFIHDAKFGNGLYIRGQRIIVLWNRVKVLPAEGRYERMSRVVRIKGPANDFSVSVLVEFFQRNFEFDLITSKEWVQWDGKRIVELAFSSIRSQSESAMKSFKLHVDQNMPNAGYLIWYAPDPCFKPNYGDSSQLHGGLR